MTPDYYLANSRFTAALCRNFNPAQQDNQQMLKIAVGPGGSETEWSDWTATIMKAYQNRQWSWDMNGLSMHSYTVVRWPPAFASAGFGETEYAQILKSTLDMDGLIAKHSAIMDKYDSQKKVALVVDEWGAWYAPLAGSNPGLPGSAEQPAGCHSGCAQSQHLRASRRSRAHGEHRSDDQCAAGDDHDRQREDGPDADLLRLQNVRALPGRNLCAGHIQR